MQGLGGIIALSDGIGPSHRPVPSDTLEWVETVGKLGRGGSVGNLPAPIETDGRGAVDFFA